MTKILNGICRYGLCMSDTTITLRISILSGLALCVLYSGCGNVLLNLTSGGKEGASSFKLDEGSALNDTASRCGGSISELSDPNNAFFAQSLTSNVLVSGSRRDINYNVKVRATVRIESKGGKSSSEVQAVVVDITGDSKGEPLVKGALDTLVRPEAESSTKKKNAKSTSTSVPSIDLLRYYKDESSQLKGVFCAVGLTKSSKVSKSVGTVEFEFKEPMPLSLNPKAALATYESELTKTPRTFSTTATIKQASADSLPAGSTAEVTVVWKKLSQPILSQAVPASDANDLPSIKADAAYEVSISVSSGGAAVAPEKLGLTRRRVFFVDSSSKRFSAIVDDPTPDPESTEKVPVTILVGQ
jgi:hypothetical protein